MIKAPEIPWHSMQTAPKDSGDVLLSCRTTGGRLYVTVGFWSDDDKEWQSSINHNGYDHAVLQPVAWSWYPTAPLDR